MDRQAIIQEVKQDIYKNTIKRPLRFGSRYVFCWLMMLIQTAQIHSGKHHSG